MVERPITNVISTLIDRVTELMRNESELARKEIGEICTQAANNLSMALVGAVLILPGLIILLEALVAGLVRAGMTEPWASLLVGGGTLLAGFLCISIGINRLKSQSLVPNKTLKQLQLDMAVVQEAGKPHDA